MCVHFLIVGERYAWTFQLRWLACVVLVVLVDGIKWGLLTHVGIFPELVLACVSHEAEHKPSHEPLVAVVSGDSDV